ncbi:hypothetical protein IPJ70_03380 [Candidatus Campbellbacteria bacterium]|nr:MAG: hypothetical protein IPJ70_03380 [Candidatus Campbellbacteria bacterium]
MHFKQVFKISLCVVLLATFFGLGSTQHVFAAPACGSSNGYLVGSASPNPVDTSVTLSVVGNLSVGRCWCERTGGPAYQYVSGFGTQTQPVDTATITAGPSGFVGQTIPLSILPGTVGVCDEGASALGDPTNFNGSHTFNTTGLTNGSYTVTVTVVEAGGTASKTANITFTVEHPVAPTLPTVSLSATPSSVSQGQTTTLSWTSTNATSCAATGGTGFSTGNTTSGSDTSSVLMSNTTFSISCTGAGGTATDSATVTVGASSAPTATLSVSPATTTTGGTVTLTWTSTNATSCTGVGPGFSTGGAISGSDISSPLTTNTTFTVSCTGPGGGAGAPPVDVSVTGDSVTGSCSVTPTSITTGQNATWSASPSGGNGSYTYSWSGTDSLSGASQTIVKTYGTSGTKNGSVTISSNGESTGALSCGTVMVSTPEGFDIGQCLTPPDGGTYATAPTPACYIGTPSSISGSGPWTWTCVGSAGTDSCIAYKATTPTNGVCAAPPDGGTYTTAPTPACQVGTASSISGSGPWTWTCAGIAGGTTANCTAYKTTANPIIWVTSNIGTTYTITQGVNTVVDQTTPVTFKGHYNLGSGTYTIHPATKDGYGTPTVAPSATQDMTEADITFAINYPAAATTGMVIVESNLPTTWTLTGPSGVQTQGTNSLGVEYQDQSAGTYTLSNVPEKEGYTVTVESGGTLFAGGTLTLTITYTPDVTPPGGPSVDLKVNNSNGPVTIVSGSTALFTWTSSGVNKGTCVGSTDSRLNTWWDGAKSEESIAGERSDVISATTTYTITCDRSDAETTVTDSVVLGARPYACNDGYDNDGDGKVDYSTDPGCTSLIDDTEENSEPVNCQTDPSNPECAVQTEPVTQCNDGLDNDGDGKIDWNGAGAVLKDPGCKNAEDPSELDDPIIKEI